MARFWTKDQKLALFFWLLGMTLTALVTFPNYYTMRLYAYDFGYIRNLYENIINLSFRFPTYKNYSIEVAPHFSYVPYLIGIPFYGLGGGVGLLTYQWLMVGLGAWGVYSFAKKKGLPKAAWTILHYFGLWPIYGLLGDLHPELLGPFLIPWLFYAIESEKKKLFLILAFIFAFSKSIYVYIFPFLMLTIFLLYRKSKAHFVVSLMKPVSILYGLALVGLYGHTFFWEKRLGMPSRVMQEYAHWWAVDLKAIGDQDLWESNPTYPSLSYKQRFFNLIKNSPYMVSALVEPVGYGKNNYKYTGVKVVWYIFSIVNGGWGLFWNPTFLIAYLPSVLYKMLALHPGVWGLKTYHGLEMILLLPIVVIWTVSRWCFPWVRLIIPLNALFSLGLTFVFYTSSTGVHNVKINFLDKSHYTSAYDLGRIRAGLAQIPKEAPIAVVSRLAPYTDYKHHPLYMAFVPGWEKADYLALLRDDPFSSSYANQAISVEQLSRIIDSLCQSSNWRKVYDRDSLLIFRRVNVEPHSGN